MYRCAVFGIHWTSILGHTFVFIGDMMNERIKELAEQAQKIVGYLDGGYTEIKALDQEKFAELIVRECANYLDDFNKENMVEEGIGGAELKKHFGVE